MDRREQVVREMERSRVVIHRSGHYLDLAMPRRALWNSSSMISITPSSAALSREQSVDDTPGEYDLRQLEKGLEETLSGPAPSTPEAEEQAVLNKLRALRAFQRFLRDRRLCEVSELWCVPSVCFLLPSQVAFSFCSLSSRICRGCIC